MVGTFSQNVVTLIGLPMISPSKSDLTFSVWSVLSCISRRLTKFFIDMIPHCIYDWVLIYLLYNTCVVIIMTCYVMVCNELCKCEMRYYIWNVLSWNVINREGIECDLWLNFRTSDVTWWVLKWCELCQSWTLLYLYCCNNYIILIFMSYLYAFVYLYSWRNVMTHFSCVVYAWILWWSWTLCLWEQMTR